MKAAIPGLSSVVNEERPAAWPMWLRLAPENATDLFNTTAGLSVAFAVAAPAAKGAVPLWVAVPSVNDTTHHDTSIV